VELGGYIGYFLNQDAADAVRSKLVINGQAVPTRWTVPEDLHVTERFPCRQEDGMGWAEEENSKPREIRVLAYVLDNQGIETLHVALNGNTTRPDGKQYHITRSVADGRRAHESTVVIDKALAGEEPERYVYIKLSELEQFNVAAEPRWKQTDSANVETAKT
jgi:hypothetical protein